jgi:predicted nucleic acid-binding protein
LINPETPHIADASAIINLNASGMAAAIIQALPHRLQVVDIVLQELESGRPKGRLDAELLRGLINQGLIELVSLGPPAEIHFENLVVGPAEATLDDGEAATIAFAIEANAIAIIDERKAKRICAQRHSGLVLRTTVDILAGSSVGIALGTTMLADALFNALTHGRMRVAEDRLEWVVSQIGKERARQCESLPRRIRNC